MNNPYQSAVFLKSAAKLDQCPPDIGAEVAFCGRSNAGKSSAINALTGQKKLARTSKTPGRTQLINFFQLESEHLLVDLPGYGYAKVPTSVKQHWHKHLDEYLRGRDSLRGLVLLMDIRHPMKPFDEMMCQWCIEASLPLHILLTKADKLKQGPRKGTLLKIQREIAETATVQLFSATTNIGIRELHKKLDQWLSNGG